jgi:hypothetical protein
LKVNRLEAKRKLRSGTCQISEIRRRRTAIGDRETTKRLTTEVTEGPQRAQSRVKRREVVALERKSPPFAGRREGWGTLKFLGV